MFNLKVLTKENVESLLQMEEVIATIESIYQQKSLQKTTVFPLVFHEFEPGVSDMDIKSGWLPDAGIFGLKLVSWFGGNADKNLPALIGTILVCDDKTGAPIGILDGSHITGMRTGAAGAIGAKYLARPDSETLLIVGAGHVATFQAAATLSLFPEIKKVLIYDALDFDNAKTFTGTIAKTLEEMNIKVSANTSFIPVKNIEEATGMADIIITVTPSKKPIIMKNWVKPGTHFSCIGADMAEKEEIDPEIFRDARVFVDDIPQCINVGEIEIPIKKEILNKEDIVGEIGDIQTGKATGRQNESQITVFDATGTALLDLATAKIAFAAAEKSGVASTVTL